MVFQYIKHFLSERCICTRAGKTYSPIKNIDIGIPQASIIAPIVFTVLIHALPKALSKNTNVAQYADDIAIWVNTTNKKVVNYVQKLYQSELNKLIIYMKENGLELSGDKTCLILFHNGENPKRLP